MPCIDERLVGLGVVSRVLEARGTRRSYVVEYSRDQNLRAGTCDQVQIYLEDLDWRTW